MKTKVDLESMIHILIKRSLDYRAFKMCLSSFAIRNQNLFFLGKAIGVLVRKRQSGRGSYRSRSTRIFCIRI